MSIKSIKQIPDNYVIEALQVVRNYCLQNGEHCSDCMLTMEDTTCLFYAELPDRFDKWKRENGISAVGERKRHGKSNTRRNSKNK